MVEIERRHGGRGVGVVEGASRGPVEGGRVQPVLAGHGDAAATDIEHERPLIVHDERARAVETAAQAVQRLPQEGRRVRVQVRVRPQHIHGLRPCQAVGRSNEQSLEQHAGLAPRPGAGGYGPTILPHGKPAQGSDVERIAAIREGGLVQRRRRWRPAIPAGTICRGPRLAEVALVARLAVGPASVQVGSMAAPTLCTGGASRTPTAAKLTGVRDGPVAREIGLQPGQGSTSADQWTVSDNLSTYRLDGSASS